MMKKFQLRNPLEADLIVAYEGNVIELESGEEIPVSDAWIGNNTCKVGDYYSPGGVIRSAAYFESMYVEVILPEDQADPTETGAGEGIVVDGKTAALKLKVPSAKSKK